jgi:ribosome-associated protein
MGSTMRIAENVVIDERDLQERFVRASGPGGQNVNKLSTAVELRFDVRRSVALSEEVKARLESLAGRRMSKDGILVIDAQRFRTQDLNRQDARERLAALIRQALERPRRRRPTKPKFSAKVERLQSKKTRSRTKQMRGRVNVHD